MYIYIDILIITNIYINYFLLKATSKMTHSVLRDGKCIISALIGSLFSLIILLPELNTAVLLLIRILTAFIMVFVSFYGKTFRELYRIGLIFFFICFIFAGIEYGLSTLFKNSIMVWNNGILYFDIPLIMLIISTIISYIAISLFRYFIDSRNDYDGEYVITIINKNKKTELKAICDTCNNLTDSFSGKPIIICSKESMKTFFDESELNNMINLSISSDVPAFNKGWRLIPFSTINSSGLLPSFLPNSVYIKNKETNKIKYTAAYIGIVEKDMDYAIFNPKILIA